MANYSTVGFNLKTVASMCYVFKAKLSAVITDVFISRPIWRMF